jgi:hypothetical protein
MKPQPGTPRRPRGCGRFFLYAELVLTRIAALYGISGVEPNRYYLWLNPGDESDPEDAHDPQNDPHIR